MTHATTEGRMSERELIERLRDSHASSMTDAWDCQPLVHFCIWCRADALSRREIKHKPDCEGVALVAAADAYLRETAQAGARDCQQCGGWHGAEPAPVAVAAPGGALTKFDYLLNAMEAAGQADVPAAHGYGDKRLALYAHIRRLEADANRLAAAESRAAEMERRLAQVAEYTHNRVERVGELRAERDALAERLAAVEREYELLRAALGDMTRKAAERESRFGKLDADRDRLAAALAQREGEVAQAYRWASDKIIAWPGTITERDNLYRVIATGPTPPDGEG